MNKFTDLFIEDEKQNEIICPKSVKEFTSPSNYNFDNISMISTSKSNLII